MLLSSSAQSALRSFLPPDPQVPNGVAMDERAAANQDSHSKKKSVEKLGFIKLISQCKIMTIRNLEVNSN